MIKRFNKKGFTLVEIIVVLVILAILAAIAVPSVLGYVEEAKKEKYIAEAKSIYTVIQVEKARLENEIDYTDVPSDYRDAEEYMCLKICDKSGPNKIGEGIVSQKTGIPKVSNIYPIADDRNDLVRKLKEQNLFLVSCQDVTKKTVNQYKMKLNELSAYSREVGTMLEVNRLCWTKNN